MKHQTTSTVVSSPLPTLEVGLSSSPFDQAVLVKDRGGYWDSPNGLACRPRMSSESSEGREPRARSVQLRGLTTLKNYGECLTNSRVHMATAVGRKAKVEVLGLAIQITENSDVGVTVKSRVGSSPASVFKTTAQPLTNNGIAGARLFGLRKNNGERFNVRPRSRQRSACRVAPTAHHSNPHYFLPEPSGLRCPRNTEPLGYLRKV